MWLWKTWNIFKFRIYRRVASLDTLIPKHSLLIFGDFSFIGPNRKGKISQKDAFRYIKRTVNVLSKFKIT